MPLTICTLQRQADILRSIPLSPSSLEPFCLWKLSKSISWCSSSRTSVLQSRRKQQDKVDRDVYCKEEESYMPEMHDEPLSKKKTMTYLRHKLLFDVRKLKYSDKEKGLGILFSRN